MPEFFGFDCGCRFEVLDKSGDFPKLNFSPRIEEINLECKRTWDLISSGNTKGCFQLESRLGQSMAKKLKPENIEQLSALISIMRPGSLEAIRDGKSVSNHFIDKKNFLESIDYFHPSLEPSLKTTYGEMIYQEQAMQIAQTIAGFDLKEADMLRKAIGKKKPEEMAKVKKRFLEGIKQENIVTTQQAEEIFGWIEKSQRYSFNKSHAVSYAINGYLSAYAKAHFPKVFFASYLKFAKDKIDPHQEIKELVKNANQMDIDVKIPDFRNLNKFFILKDQNIYFGLTDIKGVGESVYNKIISLTENLDVNNATWFEILYKVLLNINSTASKALIIGGAFDYFKKNRTELLFQYDICSSLTKKELEHFASARDELSETKDLSKILSHMIDNYKILKKRKEVMSGHIKSIHSPPFSLTDKIEWLSDSENGLLGVAITCSKLDSYDITSANTNCREFRTTLNSNIIIAGEICGANITKTKTGKNPGLEMAFVSIEDQYGLLDSVLFFPEAWAKYKTHIFDGNVLIFFGTKSKSKDSLIVEKCFTPKS